MAGIHKTSSSTNQTPNFAAQHEHLCSFFGWKPKWLQVLNNMKAFMFCFVCLGVFRGMSFSYFSAMLPSIEKRFGFSSQSIGTVKAMGDVSHLLCALGVAHYGGAGHRPRWIAVGSVLVGLGFLLMAAPEILFPASEISSLSAVLSISSDGREPFCNSSRNSSSQAPADCTKPNNDHINPLIVLGVADFVIGLGTTSIKILALPFVDDNVKSKNTPLYFAISFAGFIFGPVLGIAMSAGINTIYFDFSRPDFKPSDPRWISAWYLGFLIIGLGSCLMGLVLSCFPSTIRPQPSKNRKVLVLANGSNDATGEKIESVGIVSKDELLPTRPQAVTLKDLPVNIKRLLTNSTYMVKLCSQLLNAFVLSGYMSFMQKFLKEQYHLPQSTTNLAGGLPPIFTGFLGIGVGSLIIRGFKLRPRQVCHLMAASSLIGAACYFAVIGLGCDKQLIVGIDDVSDPYNRTSNDFCSNSHHCNCLDFQFSPICDTDTGKSYLSACAAGCRGAKRINNTKYYFGCSCVLSNSTSPIRTDPAAERTTRTSASRTTSHVVGGICPKSCPNFVVYVVLMAVAKFFMGIPASGVLMVQFRIVDGDLKSLANGVTTLVTSAFGMLPAPIVFGKLIDSACRLWQKNSCGDRAACWTYNADEFRWKLHAAVGVARLITCIMDLIIAFKVRNLSFDRTSDSSKKEDSLSTSTGSSKSNLPTDSSDDLPNEMQPAVMFAEVRRKSLFIKDGSNVI